MSFRSSFSGFPSSTSDSMTLTAPRTVEYRPAAASVQGLRRDYYLSVPQTGKSLCRLPSPECVKHLHRFTQGIGSVISGDISSIFFNGFLCNGSASDHDLHFRVLFLNHRDELLDADHRGRHHGREHHDIRVGLELLFHELLE